MTDREYDEDEFEQDDKYFCTNCRWTFDIPKHDLGLDVCPHCGSDLFIENGSEPEVDDE